MKWKLLSLGLICLIVLSACGGSSGSSGSSGSTSTPSSSVKIDGVLLARDDGNGKPGEIVTTFKPSDRTIHGVVKLDHLESGLNVKFSWVAVAAAGSTNQILAEQKFSALTETTLYGSVALPEDWPTGKYRFDIYVNDTLAKSVDFTVA